MKMNTVTHQRLYVLMASVAILFSAASSLSAQQTKFKAGDRVEVDVRGSLQEQPKWVKATVVEVMTWQGRISGIYVKTDDGSAMTVKETDLRMATGQAEAAVGFTRNPANKQQSRSNDGQWKPIVDESNTVLANRELIDCDFERPTVSPNARPPVELLKKLIRCANERPASKGSDGAVTIDITKFVVGTPRKWVARSDFGNGNANTIVYPIEVGYTLTKFYRSGNTMTDYVWIYGCWVNNHRKWECGTNQKVKASATRNIP